MQPDHTVSSKRCARCGETKGIDQFYVSKGRPDGWCKPCFADRARAWRAANPERSRELSQRWRPNNPERARIVARAGACVRRAIKKGTLVRPATCEACGEGGSITAAHADYGRPLEVRWLCRPCHGRWDRADPKSSPDALATVSATYVPYAGSAMPGERHPEAKLTDTDVLLMRQTYADGGISQRQLAARFGVSQAIVSRILLRKGWKHV